MFTKERTVELWGKNIPGSNGELADKAVAVLAALREPPLALLPLSY